MTGELRLARLGPTDASSLAHFFAQLSADSIAASLFHPHPFTVEQAKIVAGYSGRDYYAAAFVGEEIAAYGMLRGWDEGYAIPSLGIAVAPAHRGSGIGRLMMDYLHAVARLSGAPSIMLKVYKSNEAAVQLYRRMRYVLTDLNEREWRGTFQLSQPGGDVSQSPASKNTTS